jgi:hypothetical protein
MRRSLILSTMGAVALAALPAATAPAQVAGSVPGCTQKPQRAHGNFKATLHVRWDGHKPHHWVHAYNRDEKKVTWFAKWPIKVTASRNGRGISGGKVYYQFLSFGRIVACRTVLKPYVPRFHSGTFRDEIQWPERSIGLPLTFRVVVFTKYGVKNLNYTVTVQKRKK